MRIANETLGLAETIFRSPKVTHIHVVVAPIQGANIGGNTT